MNSQGQSSQNYSKIVLKFYRRFASHPNTSNKGFPFLIFGYFDAMSVDSVETLDDFYNDVGDKIHVKHQNYEIYRLCLYSRNDDLHETGNILREIQDAPLIVISEVKLNVNILEGGTTTLDEIIDFLRKSISSKIDEDKLNKIEFSIFSSLGYSDFVIIFRGDEYQSIANLIFHTRNLNYNQSSRKPCKLLKSSYSISGVHFKSLNNIDPQKKNDVLLRFSQISSRGQKEINDGIRKALELKGEENKINTVFGKYDLELHLKSFPIVKIMNLFKPGGVLDPLGWLHRDFLGHTSTHWLFECQNGGKQDSPRDRSMAPELKVNFANIKIEGMKKAFYQLVQNFYQLERDDASDQSLIDELRDVILDFYHQGEENLKRINETQSTDKYLDLQEHYNDMQKGLEIITQLLNSRVQAFRFYSEVPSYDIQFVRSATKLYLMYMNVVADVEKLIEKNLGKDHINIFVTLGYFGKVKQDEFFPATRKSLVAINLGIDSFFNIPYNILLLFHEISHSVPPCNTKELEKLYNKIIPILCNSLASLMTARVFSGDEKIKINPIYPYSDENYQSMRESLSNFIKDNINKLEFGKNFRTDKLAIDFWNNFQYLFVYYDESVRVAWNELVKEWNPISGRHPTDLQINDLEQIIYRLKDLFESGEEIKPIEELFAIKLGNLCNIQLCTKKEKELLEQRWQSLINEFKESKEKVISRWAEFIHKDWSPIITEINETLPSQLPNYSILEHFLQCNVLEGTEINSKELAKKILFYINKNKEKLFENIKKCEKLINEFLADYSMCNILKLKWDVYLSMINLYVKENNALLDVTELDYRKTMMAKSDLYSSSVKLTNESQKQKDINSFLDNINFKELAENLGKLEKLTINSEVIEVLHKYYRNLNQDDLSVKHPLEKDVSLIESLYSLSIKELS